MTDRHLEEELSAFLDGELTLEDQARVSQHLDACADCRTDLQRLEETITLLRQLPSREAPKHLTDAAMRLVDARSRRVRWLSQLRRVFFEPVWPKLSLGIAALASIALAAVLTSQEIPFQGSNEEASSQAPDQQSYSRAAHVETNQYSLSLPSTPPGAAAPASPPLAGAAPPRSAPAPMPNPAIPDISGRLVVSDLQAGMRKMRELTVAVGGEEIGIVHQAGAVVFTVTVPESELRRFMAGFATVGQWQATRAEASAWPDLRVQIRLIEANERAR